MSPLPLDPKLLEKLSAHRHSIERPSTDAVDWASFLADVSLDYRWRDEILESARDNILSVDSEGGILYANHGFLAFSREELLRKNIFELLDRRAYRLKRALKSAFDERRSDYHEAIYRGPAGEAIHFSHRVSPVVRDGAVVSAVVVATDITEQKELSDLAGSSRNLLHQGAKMIALGELAGGLANEVGTSLTTILLNVSLIKTLLMRTPVDETEIHAHLDSVGASATRISGVFGSLQTFARDETNDPVDWTPVEKIVENAVALCRERFSNEGVALRVAEITRSLHCNARPVQVSQVLLNLLNNAREAARESTEKWVKVEVQVVDSALEISVTNSGAEIPAAIRQKIFQPFFTTKTGGIGLGLSISRHLIEKLGGTLQLDSKSEQTRFAIRLLGTR